jgi:RNA polymerase sigma-70 factor (ECF subfamily)
LLRHNIINIGAKFHTGKRDASLEIPLNGDQSSDLAGTLIGGDSTPSAHAMAHEQARAVEQALLRLPDEYRQVILLHYQDGLPFEEIGRQMNRSANAAEKLWLRAIERMRQELEKPR